jgi:hypothetical protein
MTEPRTEANDPFYKVRMSETLFRELGASGVDWGEPDAEGFYTPTVYRENKAAAGLRDEAIELCPECGGQYSDLAGHRRFAHNAALAKASE